MFVAALIASKYLSSRSARPLVADGTIDRNFLDSYQRDPYVHPATLRPQN